MSSVQQDKCFYDFIDEIENIFYSDAEAKSFIERVKQAFENGELTTSQYDKIIRECEEYVDK
jgi:hypothetical protein